ncbi:aldehyde dehydrogenase family protein [Streptomyces sp. NPDC094038]|uniref:aldehyde dehydrogenase family protein n=1 Tax=Streptomyces sp. NPDC094038 TaxID=3366055 RepID=UPI003829A740
MGPLVTKIHRDKVAGCLDVGTTEGADLVVDGRKTAFPGNEGDFFLGGSFFDHVTPEMRSYRVRQRYGDLHRRREHGPHLPGRGQGGHGRRQRAHPGATRTTIRTPDFLEGVRAALADKDRRPVWQGASRG